jgi:hypothetical protein
MAMYSFMTRINMIMFYIVMSLSIMGLMNFAQSYYKTNALTPTVQLTINGSNAIYKTYERMGVKQIYYNLDLDYGIVVMEM